MKIYGTLDFIAGDQTGDIINITSTGDLSGTKLSNLSVTAFRGTPVSATAPTLNQPLVFQGNSWTPVTIGGDSSGSLSALINTGLRTLNIDPKLPAVATAQNYALVWDNANSQWTASAQTGGVATSVTMNGDVTGASNASSVISIRGITASPVAPTLNQFLVYQGGMWTPVTQGGDVTGSISSNSVVALRGLTINPLLPSVTSDTYALTWDATNNQWTAKPGTGYITWQGLYAFQRI